ncbi:MAG TPA: hypothetical protein ENJ06_00330 [Phycisphaeraceae bacterium]|nr:hypothetical protein [Phycisphaeraceae bacterium]
MPDQTTISDLIRQLPVSVHVMALAGLMIGVIVLLAGGKLVRPLVLLVGASFGAFLGLAAIAFFPDAGDPLIGIGIGAVVGLLFGLLMFRFYMAVALALLLGIIAPVGVFAYGSLSGTWSQQEQGPVAASEQLLDDVPVTRDEATTDNNHGNDKNNPENTGERRGKNGGKSSAGGNENKADSPDGSDGSGAQVPDLTEDAIKDAMTDALSQAAVDAAKQTARDAADKLNEQAGPVMESAGKIMRAIFKECRTRFDDLPGGEQWAVSLAAMLGFVFGAVIGLILPKSAARIVTAAAGSALVIWCFSWLSVRYQVPVAQGLPTHPAASLALWTIIWVAGVIFQWTTAREKPDD